MNSTGSDSLKRVFIISAVLLALNCGASNATENADTILFNGKIVTVNDQFQVEQAIAIKGQRILAVGKTENIMKLKGPETKLLDL